MIDREFNHGYSTWNEQLTLRNKCLRENKSLPSLSEAKLSEQNQVVKWISEAGCQMMNKGHQVILPLKEPGKLHFL